MPPVSRKPESAEASAAAPTILRLCVAPNDFSLRPTWQLKTHEFHNLSAIRGLGDGVSLAD
ncbi:MAG TPA: hypothetical protein VLM40_18860 [Gemmata sp.]|nr:hypothetical protein [Gemmata sp.]